MEQPDPPENSTISSWRRFGLAGGAAAAFLTAFLFTAVLQLSHIERNRHVEPPDLPALAGDPDAAAVPMPVDPFFLREGSWNWPRGGRFFVLPGALRELSPKSLRPVPGPAAEGYELCAAAAWAANWHRGQLGLPLEKRLNRLAGREKSGLTPLALAALYETQDSNSGGLPLSEPQRLDPVSQRQFPCSLRGMGRLFARAAEARATSSTLLRLSPPQWPFDAESLRLEELAQTQAPIEILPPRPLGPGREAREASEALAAALRRHGAVLAGLAEGAWPASRPHEGEFHVRRAAIVIGDYEYLGKRIFLLRSPLGFADSPEAEPFPTAVASARALIGALAFPHPARAVCERLDNGRFRLVVRDAIGRPLPLRLPQELQLNFDGLIRLSPRKGEFLIEPALGVDPADLVIELSPPRQLPPGADKIRVSLR
jgi:hypothetical protein